jgi:hypothetical protein
MAPYVVIAIAAIGVPVFLIIGTWLVIFRSSEDGQTNEPKEN